MSFTAEYFTAASRWFWWRVFFYTFSFIWQIHGDYIAASMSSLFACHLLLAKVNTTAIHVARTGQFGLKNFFFFFFIKNLNLAWFRVHGNRR